MSMVHYLTVGRFGFTEDSVPPGLRDRVVAHFVPGGLQRLGRPTSFIVPWNAGELAELEDAVKQRYQLELDLNDYLTDQGLLCMQYTGVEVHIAYPVAVVAGELFGASAGERGEVSKAVHVRALAELHAQENRERKRIAAIREGSEHLRAVLEALRIEAGYMPLWLAERSIADVAPAIVPELIELLAYHDDQISPLQNQRIRTLAVGGLREAGPAALSAVPALTALLRDDKTDRLLTHSIALALAAMGPGAEPGLAAALDLNHWPRGVALKALARLDSISDTTRGKLIALAQGAGEAADMAKHALGESPMRKRLAELREAMARRDPVAESRELARRLEQGQLGYPQLRFAAYLGDPASQIVIDGTRAKPVDDLSTWVTGLPDAPAEWGREVAAAALEARSMSLLPRSAVLTQAVAQTAREGKASERLQGLLESHDWIDVPGLEYSTLTAGVAASETTGEEHRRRLLEVVRHFEDDDRAAFLLLLHEEAIPRVLCART